MKYFYTLVFLFAISQNLYSAQKQECRNHYFDLKWETMLPSYDDKSYARPLTNAIAVIQRKGRISLFDKVHGNHVRDIVFPSQNIQRVDSINDTVVFPDYLNFGVLNVVNVSSSAQDKISVSQVDTGLDYVGGLASIPEMQRFVVGGGTANYGSGIVDFRTDTWQRVREVEEVSSGIDQMATLPGENGIVGYLTNYRARVYDLKNGETYPVRIPQGPNIVMPIAIKGNNIFVLVKKNNDQVLRLYRNERDLNLDFPVSRDAEDWVDEGRGTIVVGLNKYVSIMNGNGQILQRFTMGGDIQNVKYIKETDGRDLIAATSLDSNTHRLKLSVWLKKELKARL